MPSYWISRDEFRFEAGQEKQGEPIAVLFLKNVFIYFIYVTAYVSM